MVICLKRGANDLHMVQLMPPHRLCFRKSRVLYPSVTSVPGLSWKKTLLIIILCEHFYEYVEMLMFNRKSTVVFFRRFVAKLIDLTCFDSFLGCVMTAGLSHFCGLK